jgi:hypothetical protein
MVDMALTYPHRFSLNESMCRLSYFGVVNRWNDRDTHRAASDWYHNTAIIAVLHFKVLILPT